MGHPIRFYDVKEREEFTTSDYTVKKTKNGRFLAIAMRNGRKIPRFISEEEHN